MFPFLAELTDDGIGERFPSYVAVGAGFVRPYRQYGVQGEHALFGILSQDGGGTA